MNEAEAPSLPAHIEAAVQAIAKLHAEHHERASPMEKMIERLTARAGRPGFIGFLTALAFAWIALNVMLKAMGRPAIDEPPFFWMQSVTGLAALYMTTLILITQRRENQLASLREQLTLELGMLGEQKAAKMIELLEELRRDDPHVQDRVDPQAIALSAPADPQTVLDAIKETHDP